MMPRNSMIPAAGLLLMLSGVLHILSFVMHGFTYGSGGLAPVGLIFLGLGWLLITRSWRWLAYIVYLSVGIGASFALREIFHQSGAHDIVYGLILVVDVLAVAVLFVALWRSPTPASA